MAKLLREAFAPYPNLMLRPDTIEEMHQLFENCDIRNLKTAVQSAMLDSGDFFPGPGKIMSHYKSLLPEEPKQEVSKHWSESSNNESCTLTITKSGKDEHGKHYEDKREYLDLTADKLFRIQSENYKKGLVKVITRRLPSYLAYSYELKSVVESSNGFKLIGYSLKFGESIPVYECS